MATTLIGWVALVLTQIYWIPNIARIVRTRDVQGYSLLAWVIMLSGLSCWMVYFISRGDTVGIIANVCGVTGASVTTGLIWYWGRARHPMLAPVAAAHPPEMLTSDQG